MVKDIFASHLNISHEVNYRNFGYIPSRSIRDIRGKLFGHVNLLKRLQAKDVMAALDIKRNEVILDLGCGAGYFTVEMAKLAQTAYGVDIHPFLRQIQVPSAFAGRLKFIIAKGEVLPFREESFDKILASEILPMGDPKEFLKEIKRVMKKKGKVVICNGAGHPSIRKAYQRESRILKVIKKIYKQKVPVSYEEYCSILQNSFGTSQNKFLEKEEVCNLLKEIGFEPESVIHSPGFTIGWYISWSQFLLYLRKGKALSQKYFYILYPLASFINRLQRSRYEGGLICTARKD